MNREKRVREKNVSDIKERKEIETNLETTKKEYDKKLKKDAVKCEI